MVSVRLGAAGELENFGRDQPGSALDLGQRVFNKELRQLILALRETPLQGVAALLQEALKIDDIAKPTPPPEFVSRLTLNVDKILELEEKRGVPESSPFVKALFFVLCWTLDRLYEGRPIQKFWVLETVARLPYFSYITVIHFYESLGWWRTPQIRQVHNAEEDNELHHLLIMEALGGNRLWFDRFAAQHAALAYYWAVVVLFFLAPQLAYNFSLLVEEHAYVTYAQFVEENKEVLKSVLPPPVAVEYYVSGDLYFFDKFQTAGKAKATETGETAERRRPPCNNMLDVFTNIRDDELEHVLTMKACQDWWAGGGPSPLGTEETNRFGDRAAWKKWSDEVNKALPRKEPK